MLKASEFADMMLDLERIADASVDSLFALGCAQHDLTMNQMRILMELKKGSKYTVGELSSVLGIMRGNMAGICKKLEERELIARTRSKEDERVVYMELSTKGKQLSDEILQQIQVKHAQAFSEEEEATFEKILDGLKALYALLEKM